MPISSTAPKDALLRKTLACVVEESDELATLLQSAFDDQLVGVYGYKLQSLCVPDIRLSLHKVPVSIPLSICCSLLSKCGASQDPQIESKHYEVEGKEELDFFILQKLVPHILGMMGMAIDPSCSPAMDGPDLFLLVPSHQPVVLSPAQGKLLLCGSETKDIAWPDVEASEYGAVACRPGARCEVPPPPTGQRVILVYSISGAVPSSRTLEDLRLAIGPPSERLTLLRKFAAVSSKEDGSMLENTRMWILPIKRTDLVARELVHRELGGPGLLVCFADIDWTASQATSTQQIRLSCITNCCGEPSCYIRSITIASETGAATVEISCEPRDTSSGSPALGYAHAHVAVLWDKDDAWMLIGGPVVPNWLEKNQIVIHDLEQMCCKDVCKDTVGTTNHADAHVVQWLQSLASLQLDPPELNPMMDPDCVVYESPEGTPYTGYPDV